MKNLRIGYFAHITKFINVNKYEVNDIDLILLLDDVDTDLLRLLAAKAMAVNKVDKSKKHWPKQNGITPPIQADPG